MSAKTCLEGEGFKRAGRIVPVDGGAACQKLIEWTRPASWSTPRL
jgi:hypothetical protein